MYGEYRTRRLVLEAWRSWRNTNFIMRKQGSFPCGLTLSWMTS
jgi:hypothetical protein